MARLRGDDRRPGRRLTGLLFVAVSIKSDALAKSLSLRSRAAQTLVLFMTSALTGLVLVVPQPGNPLGGELIGLALLSGTALYVLDRRGGHDQASGVARYVEKGSPNTITALFFGVAGLTLLIAADGSAAATASRVPRAGDRGGESG